MALLLLLQVRWRVRGFVKLQHSSCGSWISPGSRPPSRRCLSAPAGSLALVRPPAAAAPADRRMHTFCVTAVVLLAIFVGNATSFVPFVPLNQPCLTLARLMKRPSSTAVNMRPVATGRNFDLVTNSKEDEKIFYDVYHPDGEDDGRPAIMCKKKKPAGATPILGATRTSQEEGGPGDGGACRPRLRHLRSRRHRRRDASCRRGTASCGCVSVPLLTS